MLKIVRAIFIIFLAFFIFAAGSILFQKYIQQSQYPTIFGYGASVVVSGSMAPEINIDDVLITKQQDQYCQGDVVSYTDPTMGIVTHRIINIDDDGNCTTKGDANSSSDSIINASDIKGKVVNVFPNAAWITDSGVLTIIFIILFLFLILTIMAQDRRYRKHN